MPRFIKTTAGKYVNLDHVVEVQQVQGEDGFRLVGTKDECIGNAAAEEWVDLPRFRGRVSVGFTVPELAASCPPVSNHSLVRPPAEPFFRPDPRAAAAVARSGGQGRPRRRGRPKGLPLTAESTTAGWCASGSVPPSGTDARNRQARDTRSRSDDGACCRNPR